MTDHRSPYQVMLRQTSRRARQRGFTLIELIMVIVLLGVLAVYAVPRIFNSNDFNARGFHDETLSILRYAQKTAIAQRRTVCLTFTINSVTLNIASAAPTPAVSTPTCVPSSPLQGPRGESPATITAKSGVSYSSTPTNFNFDGLGQPINADGTGALLTTSSTISINNAADVMVEAVTGYVHE